VEIVLAASGDVVVPEDALIDLLVLSHTDGDHVAAVPAICRDHPIRTVARPGIRRDTKVWKDADVALRSEAQDQGMTDVRLPTEMSPGVEHHLDGALVPLRFARPSPPSGWAGDSHPQAAGHARHT